MRTSDKPSQLNQVNPDQVKAGVQNSRSHESEVSMDSGTNQHVTKKSHAFKSLIIILCFVLIFVLLNQLCCFLFEPYLGSSEEMWRGFRAKDNVDLVYTGSSQCITGIDPSVVDRELGTSSYNMGTNMQSFYSSYHAIKTAIEEKHVTTVVLSLDDELLYEDFNNNFRADASFQHAADKTAPNIAAKLEGATGFAVGSPFFSKPGSVNYLFPWIYNRDMDVAKNVKEKISGEILESDVAAHRDSNGFLPSDEVMVPDNQYVSVEDALEWDRTANTVKDLHLIDSNRDELEKICRLCKDNGVTLITVTFPYPNYLTVYSVKSYADMQNELGGLFGSYGFSYYNCNLVRPEFYNTGELTWYKDKGHMNTEGAANFSSFMAKLIKAETSEGHGATTDGNGASSEWFYRLVVDDNGARLE
ncbi:MAG: hypothetical protein PHS72_01290 [Lachnospiraceae bacterium]|nr:hypothetical protein [Lachnospiraceae bacterium]